MKSRLCIILASIWSFVHYSLNRRSPGSITHQKHESGVSADAEMTTCAQYQDYRGYVLSRPELPCVGIRKPQGQVPLNEKPRSEHYRSYPLEYCW